MLDGSSIIAGNANGATFPEVSGGGILQLHSSPTLRNIPSSGNSTKMGGGGMFNLNNSPILTDVTFHGNLAGAGG